MTGASRALDRVSSRIENERSEPRRSRRVAVSTKTVELRDGSKLVRRQHVVARVRDRAHHGGWVGSDSLDPPRSSSPGRALGPTSTRGAGRPSAPPPRPRPRPPRRRRLSGGPGDVLHRGRPDRGPPRPRVAGRSPRGAHPLDFDHSGGVVAGPAPSRSPRLPRLPPRRGVRASTLGVGRRAAAPGPPAHPATLRIARGRSRRFPRPTLPPGGRARPPTPRPRGGGRATTACCCTSPTQSTTASTPSTSAGTASTTARPTGAGDARRADRGGRRRARRAAVARLASTRTERLEIRRARRLGRLQLTVRAQYQRRGGGAVQLVAARREAEFVTVKISPPPPGRSSPHRRLLPESRAERVVRGGRLVDAAERERRRRVRSSASGGIA